MSKLTDNTMMGERTWDKIIQNVPNDPINHPSHYEGKIECIDAMVECFGAEAVASYCLCNAFKYIWRCMKKHPEPFEDVGKAEWYLHKFKELKQ